MLTFDPDRRISVANALQHPWLASYHDSADEPSCPTKFDKWKQVEELETIEDFRKALWDEIADFRAQVRKGGMPPVGRSRTRSVAAETPTDPEPESELLLVESPVMESSTKHVIEEKREEEYIDPDIDNSFENANLPPLPPPPSSDNHLRRSSVASIASTDPVVSYSRRNSLLQQPLTRQGSIYASPVPPSQQLPAPPGSDGPMFLLPEEWTTTSTSTITFPSQPQGYVVPARSRTGSTVGRDTGRKLLRTLSTVSIHESAENHVGGLAGIAPIGRFITTENQTADAPPSEMPREFGINEEAPDPPDSSDDSYDEEQERLTKKPRKFTIH